MLAKQWWKLFYMLKIPCCTNALSQNTLRIVTFLEATDWPGSSFAWRNILAAKPLLLRGTCWRVGYCQEITVARDKRLTVFYSQALLYIENDARVCDLIDPNTAMFITHLLLHIYFFELKLWIKDKIAILKSCL